MRWWFTTPLLFNLPAEEACRERCGELSSGLRLLCFLHSPRCRAAYVCECSLMWDVDWRRVASDGACGALATVPVSPRLGRHVRRIEAKCQLECHFRALSISPLPFSSLFLFDEGRPTFLAAAARASSARSYPPHCPTLRQPHHSISRGAAPPLAEPHLLLSSFLP